VTHIYIYIYITPSDCYYQSIQPSIIPNTQQRQQGHGLAPLVRPKWCMLLVTAVLGYGLLAQCASVAWVGAPCGREAREQSGDKDGGSWSPLKPTLLRQAAILDACIDGHCQSVGSKQRKNRHNGEAKEKRQLGLAQEQRTLCGPQTPLPRHLVHVSPKQS
jgi:hypothetical protein